MQRRLIVNGNPVRNASMLHHQQLFLTLLLATMITAQSPSNTALDEASVQHGTRSILQVWRPFSNAFKMKHSCVERLASRPARTSLPFATRCVDSVASVKMDTCDRRMRPQVLASNVKIVRLARIRSRAARTSNTRRVAPTALGLATVFVIHWAELRASASTRVCRVASASQASFGRRRVNVSRLINVVAQTRGINRAAPTVWTRAAEDRQHVRHNASPVASAVVRITFVKTMLRVVRAFVARIVRKDKPISVDFRFSFEHEIKEPIDIASSFESGLSSDERKYIYIYDE